MVKITLRAARVNAGLNLVDAAKLLFIHKNTLTKFERDSTNVNRLFMLQVEELYKIPMENIFFGNQSEFFRNKISS